MNRSLIKLLRERRGATAIIIALLTVPGILAAGMALDLGRVQMAKARLQSSLDSAALAAASTVGLTQAQQLARAQAFVDANFPSSVGNLTSFTLTPNTLTGAIEVAASARVPTTFLRLFGVNYLSVNENVEVKAAENALMVSLVLDVTGSMWSNSNIATLRNASTNLVNVLFGSQAVNDNLKVALVPYSASVNLGGNANGVIDPTDALHGTAGSTDPLGWKGCVVERAPLPGVPDVFDDGYRTGAQRHWTPYVAPADVDNDYTPGDASTVEEGGLSDTNNVRGPNQGCPNALVPLTSTKATVTSAIAQLTAWNRGGTLTDIGVAWGIRTLEPEAPFIESTAIDPRNGMRLWDSPRWTRAMVIMTDGDSQFFKLGGNAGENSRLPGDRSDFTGYGRLGDALATSIVGTSNSNTAKTALNTRIESLCTYAKSQGITVYTVVFTSNVGNNVRDMYRRCATDAGKYWYAPSQTALIAAFNQIGQDLVNLHISR